MTVYVTDTSEWDKKEIFGTKRVEGSLAESGLTFLHQQESSVSTKGLLSKEVLENPFSEEGRTHFHYFGSNQGRNNILVHP